MKRLLTLLFAVTSLASAITHMTPPTVCTPGESIQDTMSQGIFYCIATNTWRYQPISTLLYTQVNVANGVAGLDENKKILRSVIPDDVLAGVGSGPGIGTPGSSVLNGSGPPGAGIGNNGDFYIDTGSARLNFYGPKTSGAWLSSFVPLVGTSGTSGSNGTNGTNGTNGSNGSTILSGSTGPTSGTGNNGDYFINTTSNTLFGPKASGAWPGTGISLAIAVTPAVSLTFDTTSSTTVTFTHNLHTKSLDLSCFDSVDHHFIPGSWDTTTIDVITAYIPLGRTGRCSFISGSGPQGIQGPAGSGPGGGLTVQVNSGTATGATGINFVNGTNATVSQTTTSGITSLRIDVSGVSGSGINAGSSLPTGSCTNDSLFYLNTATQGQQLYNCVANSWLQYNNVDGSGTLAYSSGALGVTNLIPQKAHNESITGLWAFSQFSLGAPVTPASASSSCTQGTHVYDASFEYQCIATNTWKRVAISTWP